MIRACRTKTVLYDEDGSSCDFEWIDKDNNTMQQHPTIVCFMHHNNIETKNNRYEVITKIMVRKVTNET